MRVCFIEAYVDRALFISFKEPQIIECDDINDLVESLEIPSTLEAVVQGGHWVTRASGNTPSNGGGFMEGDVTSLITLVEDVTVEAVMATTAASMSVKPVRLGGTK